jgi:hypothetical protein
MNTKAMTAICVALLLVAGCGKNEPTAEDLAARKVAAEAKNRAEAEKTHKTAISAQYAKGVQAVAANDRETFKSVLDADAQNDASKVNGTWAVVRLLMGAGGLSPDDLRIDSITLNEELTMAMVIPSHREKGDWKKDKKPQIWITEGGQWHWMQ